jgi:hypothetical protein
MAVSQDIATAAEKKLGDARVFAHILEKASRLARQAADRLLSLRQTTVEHPEQVGCDPQAETLQANAVQLLDQLVAALKMEHQTRVPMQGPSPSGHAGMSQSGGRIAPIAELMVLRSLQEAVNREIVEVRKHCADPSSLTEEEKHHLDAMRAEQRKIRELFDELTAPMSTPGVERPSPAPDRAGHSLIRPQTEVGRGQDVSEIVPRASRHMADSEKRLVAKDVGEPTLRLQAQILKDLDELIDQAKRQAPSRSTNVARSTAGLHGRSGKVIQRSAPRQVSGVQASTNPNQGAKPPSAPPDAGGSPNLSSLFKQTWGHLPETLRQDIDQYSREQFMTKYSELIKRYYATIAEKGHRTGDR